jgi:hypothetical protein
MNAKLKRPPASDDRQQGRPLPASDLEVYCFLKYHLPFPYRIEAEPKTAYFSEWQYCYLLYRENEQVARWEGEFSKASEGTLVEKAARFVEEHRIQLELESTRRHNKTVRAKAAL